MTDCTVQNYIDGVVPVEPTIEEIHRVLRSRGFVFRRYDPHCWLYERGREHWTISYCKQQRRHVLYRHGVPTNAFIFSDVDQDYFELRCFNPLSYETPYMDFNGSLRQVLQEFDHYRRD